MKQEVDDDSEPSGCRENKLSLTIANSKYVGRRTLLINLNSSTPTQNCCVLSCRVYTVRFKADLVINNQSSQSGWIWAASAVVWCVRVGLINCPNNLFMLKSMLKMKNDLIFLPNMFYFCSPIWSSVYSHPPASSPISYDSYQSGRVKANACFLWECVASQPYLIDTDK